MADIIAEVDVEGLREIVNSEVDRAIRHRRIALVAMFAVGFVVGAVANWRTGL